MFQVEVETLYAKTQTSNTPIVDASICKAHAAVDALGLPIRFTITPGQWGDCPQAPDLIEGLEGVGHVMADAAYHADHLRRLILPSLCVSRMRNDLACLNEDAA